MKIYSWLVVLLFAALRLNGQINLVVNPGFEEISVCPSDSSEIRTKTWFTPTCNSPDFYYPTLNTANACFYPYPAHWGGGAYNNFFGYTLPRSGISYAGLFLAQGGEYMTGKLLDSLVLGKRYAMSFYVSLGETYFNSGGEGLDLIQVSVMRDSISDYIPPSCYTTDLSLVAHAGNQPGYFLTDTANWMLVQDTFIAQGGELYFVVGNIDGANTQYYNSNTPTPCYYYFDDFDIHCIDCEDTSAPPPPRPPAFQLFPNPNDGVFSISGPFMPQDRIVVYDAVGRLLFSYAVTQENNLLQLFPQLATGVYVCRVERGEELLFKRRVVVAE